VSPYRPSGPAITRGDVLTETAHYNYGLIWAARATRRKAESTMSSVQAGRARSLQALIKVFQVADYHSAWQYSEPKLDQSRRICHNGGEDPVPPVQRLKPLSAFYREPGPQPSPPPKIPIFMPADDRRYQKDNFWGFTLNACN